MPGPAMQRNMILVSETALGVFVIDRTYRLVERSETSTYMTIA